jgi:glycosyltransferase involved in cell wall biosynthesis
MRAEYEDADVVLNCSLSEGGMANSVLEALALGRAVLASNIEGNRSLIEDGVTGLLFDTPEEFTRKAERLIGNQELRRRLGEAGRAFIDAHFSAARELDGYMSVYASLCPALWSA